MKYMKVLFVIFAAMFALYQPAMAQSRAADDNNGGNNSGMIDWIRILGECPQGGNRSIVAPFDGLVLQDQVQLVANEPVEQATIEVYAPQGQTIYSTTDGYPAGSVTFIPLGTVLSGTYRIVINSPSGLYMEGTFER